uniref:Uncharacterized protein n=2 Tax=Meloidogyne enterolobii TaxID=390850 RepID=A0A6V7Y6S8_MELEN|nr:unnamed protein product [Meloidogyne enterolobii]
MLSQFYSLIFLITLFFEFHLPTLCLKLELFQFSDELQPRISFFQHPINLKLENAMRELHRINTDRDTISVNKKRRALKLNGFNTAKRRHILVLDAGTSINGSRCIISADQAVHFCGFAEEVNEPPILPHLNGICQKSLKSERNICYPRYEELDSSCTDAATSNERSGLVAPPVIPNAFVQVMAFVPPDNLKRLIRQYYRNHGKPYPRNETELYSPRSFLFVKYGCDPGYELQDEADTMFCRDRVWVQTPPICKGKGLCELDNGGCSHSCISFEQNRTLECRCPRGLVLDANGKTCIKPVPKSLCRKLAGCVCSPVDEKQLSCSCPNAEKMSACAWTAEITNYKVEPGGNLNITCSAVAFPFPEIVWEREQEDTTRGRADVHLTTTGTNIRSEQLLIIKQIYKNTNFTCHAHNEIGETSRLVRVVVTGPGSAPVLRQLTAGRTRIEVHWEKPHVINRPLTAYALYFTTDPMLPIKSWSQVNVSAPAISHVIHGLNSDTLYTIRVRAHDSMGPGKLSNPVSVRTLPPAIRPFVFIPEGTEIRVPPRIPFTINCNLSRGEPIPDMYWESRSRNISIAQQGRHIALQHSGLYEIFVLVTGPSQPERIRYHTDGDKIFLQWEEPRITNGPIVDYEVFYIPIVDADKPDQEWTVQRSGGPSERTLTLRPLREQTEYMVKVRALNRNGPGLFSLPFTSKTWLAPRLPTVHTVPSDHVEKRPSQEGFDVLCEAEGVPKPKILWWWENRPIEDGSGGFRIVDIASLDEQAINERGLSEAQVKMIILGPGSPPDRISVRPVLDGFSVHWEPPLIPNGDVLGYSIYWSSNPDADLAEWSQKNFDSDARDATITDQQEQTPYVIRLQAFGSDGPGLISPSYEVVTGLKHIPLNVSIRILSPSVRPEEKEGGTLVDPDQPISFECVTDGRPQPVVSWSWIPFGNTSIGSSHLTLKPDPSTFHRFISAPAEARTLTSRTLICEARNDQGQVRDGHIFRVLRPGGPPVELGSLVSFFRITILEEFVII